MTFSLRLNEDDTQLIKSYAALQGISVSELLRTAVIERIEDECDLKVYDQAMAEHKKNPVTYSLDDIERELGLRDPTTAKLILGWLRKNLEGCSDPRAHGKSLKGNRHGEWRYRIGDYRVIADIQDDKVLILVLEIGHRREIYL